MGQTPEFSRACGVTAMTQESERLSVAEDRLHTHGNRLTVMETEVRNHFKADDERYARIEGSLNKIELALTTFIDKMGRSIERIHEVIDEKVGGLSEDIANVETIARAEAKIALGLAQDAKDVADAAHSKIAVQASSNRAFFWLQAFMGLVGLICAGAWAYDHFNGGSAQHIEMKVAPGRDQ